MSKKQNTSAYTLICITDSRGNVVTIGKIYKPINEIAKAIGDTFECEPNATIELKGKVR